MTDRVTVTLTVPVEDAPWLRRALRWAAHRQERRNQSERAARFYAFAADVLRQYER